MLFVCFERQGLRETQRETGRELMRGRGSVSSCQSDLTLAGDWTREAGPGAEAGHNRWPEIRISGESRLGERGQRENL